MLTKIKKIFVLVMFAAFLVVLSGCGNGGIKGALKNLQLDAEVSEDFVLPTVNLEGAVTTWKSNSEAIVIDGTYAEVIRPSLSDAEVILTAEVVLGEKTESREFTVIVKCLEAPNKISINPGSLKPVEGKERTYYLVLTQTEQLIIEVESEAMSTDVVWKSNKDKKVEISEDGVVKGLEIGKSVITATSTSVGSNGERITDSITIEVVEDLNPNKVLLNHKKAILDSVPRFISSNYEFMLPSNTEVVATYTDEKGNELWQGNYEFLEGEDRNEVIYCELTYKGESTKFDFIINVVTDEEDNEFLALDYAENKLNDIFQKYTSADGEKIRNDIDVPNGFTKEEATYEVGISYETSCDFGTSPVLFNTIDNPDGTQSIKAVYTKPNDDTRLMVDLDITTKNVARRVKFFVYAGGYTQDEIVEYMKANVLPQADAAGEYKLTCQHITLPTDDTTKKFKSTKIVWSSSNEAVLTSEGKFANLDLAAQTKVTLTATIQYGGTISESFAFNRDVTFEFDVYPAENTAQKIALEFSGYIVSNGLMEKIQYFPFGKKDRLDENGNISNVLPLPKTIGELAPEMAEYKDLALTWAAAEEGLIDENYKLLKQYLRYHEAALTYTVEYEGHKATNEVIINVGIAELKNTIYIGGAAYQISSCPDETLKGDVLSSLSKFDAPTYTTSETYRTWGTQSSQFNGYTFYIDVYKTDDEGNKTDEFTRYQYYVSSNAFLDVDEEFTCTLTDPNDPKSVVMTANKETNPYFNGGKNFGGNWGVVYHNSSDKDIKIPFTPLSGQSFLGSADVKWADHPWAKAQYIGRDNAVGIDGYRPGFVTDGTGKVVLGDGQTYLQVNYDANNDGLLTEDDYWITVPAGGYAYTTRTQQNTIFGLLEHFCTKDNVITFQTFDPYYLSPDGSSEDLGKFIHPQF